MKRFILGICLLVLPFYAITAHAADKYVRKGASGSGTSWADAYGDFNNVNFSGLSGYTLWVAAGSYTGGLPTMNNIDNITIRRATVAAHGTSTGWSDAYDGQVTVNPPGGFIDADGCDGFTLDGASSNPWKFRIVGASGQNGMILFEGASNAVFRNIELDGNGEGTVGEDGFRFGGVTNLVVERCYIHDYPQLTSSWHNDGVQMPSGANVTFRYNIFRNAGGQHLFLGDQDWGGQFVNGITIHHNLFYNTSGSSASYNTIVFKGVSLNNEAIKIENNTFALRSNEASHGSVLYLTQGTTNNVGNMSFKNNIVYYSNLGQATNGSHSYNCFYGVSAPSETGRITSDPLFTNYAGNVFTLQAGSPCKDAGTNLGYTSDLLGTAVPQNGVPDIGAYELGGNKVTPSAPVNLRTY